MADAQGHDSRAVANRILELSRERGISLTIMQLLKLIYFAHGWYLAAYGKPLTRDKPEAWQYGPVYPSVYRSPREGLQVTGPIRDFRTGVPVVDQFAPEEEAVMVDVVEAYGKMHAFQLSQLTHVRGSPWEKTYSESGAYADIPDDLIKEYFSALKAA